MPVNVVLGLSGSRHTVSIEDFLFQDSKAETYYFTIQSLGDYETYRNSDVAVSGTYTYVRPAAQLNPCTTLFWQDRMTICQLGLL